MCIVGSIRGHWLDVGAGASFRAIDARILLLTAPVVAVSIVQPTIVCIFSAIERTGRRIVVAALGESRLGYHRLGCGLGRFPEGVL